MKKRVIMVETFYKGTPLMLQYENKHMENRLNFSFIDDYDQEEDKIQLGMSWYNRISE